jgi:hypothetical protein
MRAALNEGAANDAETGIANSQTAAVSIRLDDPRIASPAFRNKKPRAVSWFIQTRNGPGVSLS